MTPSPNSPSATAVTPDDNEAPSRRRWRLLSFAAAIILVALGFSIPSYQVISTAAAHRASQLASLEATRFHLAVARVLEATIVESMAATAVDYGGADFVADYQRAKAATDLALDSVSSTIGDETDADSVIASSREALAPIRAKTAADPGASTRTSASGPSADYLPIVNTLASQARWGTNETADAGRANVLNALLDMQSAILQQFVLVFGSLTLDTALDSNQELQLAKSLAEEATEVERVSTGDEQARLRFEQLTLHPEFDRASSLAHTAFMARGLIPATTQEWLSVNMIKVGLIGELVVELASDEVAARDAASRTSLAQIRNTILVQSLLFVGSILVLVVLAAERRGRERDRLGRKEAERLLAEVDHARASADKASRQSALDALRLTSYLTMAPLGILTVDARTGAVQMSNQTAGELFCCAPSELSGVQLLRLLPEIEPSLTRPVDRPPGGDSLRQRIVLRDFECDAVRPDGTRYPASVSLSHVDVDDTRTYICAVEDISERRLLRQQLVAQERLSSLSHLTLAVAHELNNPLNFIVNFSEELHDEAVAANAGRTDPASDTDIAMLSETVLRHSRRAQRIVSTLSSHVHSLQAGEKLPLSLNDTATVAVGQSVSAWRKRTGVDAAVSTTLDPTMPTILGDPRQLTIVVANLVINALEAQAAVGDHDSPVDVVTRVGSDRVELHVSDRGPGIPKELADSAFRPFWTSAAPGSALGLGLSVALDVTLGHGGSIVFSDRSGGGTIFMVSLPKAQAPLNHDSVGGREDP